MIEILLDPVVDTPTAPANFCSAACVALLTAMPCKYELIRMINHVNHKKHIFLVVYFSTLFYLFTVSCRSMRLLRLDNEF